MKVCNLTITKIGGANEKNSGQFQDKESHGGQKIPTQRISQLELTNNVE